jgi:GNAT superfamily N-acetyltransferase
MRFEILRADLPGDYEALAQIHTAAIPNDPVTAAWMKRIYENPPEHCRRAIYVASIDGERIGYATFSQHVWSYAPDKFSVEVQVRPEYQRLGIGHALYQHLWAALSPAQPRLLIAHARVDLEAGQRFAEARGYREMDRDWESWLDPSRISLERFNGIQDRLAAQGIEIKTLVELKESDPDYQRKVYELDWEASQDIPTAQELTQPPFEQYQKDVFENQNLIPDAFFVAVDGDRFAGTTSLWRNQAHAGELKTGFTGVARAYRRRGIALALKLRAVTYAQDQGIATVRTWNAKGNRPMLAINERLGFVRKTGWVIYQKEIRDER